MNNHKYSGPAFATYLIAAGGMDTIDLAAIRDVIRETAGEGISVRDYFAAKAMQGMAATEAFHKSISDGSLTLEQAVKGCYALSDAMLIEKNGGEA